MIAHEIEELPVLSEFQNKARFLGDAPVRMVVVGVLHYVVDTDDVLVVQRCQNIYFFLNGF